MRLHGSCGSWPRRCQLLSIASRENTVTYLLLDLQRINSRGELAQNLVGLLVELELGGDQVGQVAQGLGGIKDLNGVLC